MFLKKKLSSACSVSCEIINPQALHISMVGSDMGLTKGSTGHCSGNCGCKNQCQGEKKRPWWRKMSHWVQEQSNVLVNEELVGWLVCVNTCKRGCLRSVRCVFRLFCPNKFASCRLSNALLLVLMAAENFAVA